MTPEEFRTIFDRLGLTESELAAAAGVSRGTIAKAKARGVERGALPTVIHLFAERAENIALGKAYNKRAGG